MSEYTERDIEKLDLEGNYYCRHIVAMTREGLFGKSQIAAELAFRDCELAKLRAENQELRGALEKILYETGNDLSGRAKMFIENVLRGEK